MMDTQMWSLHTREHHSAMKRREALTLATMWMDLENTMLSERNQMEKDTVCDSTDGKRPEQANPQTQSGFRVVRVWWRGWG